MASKPRKRKPTAASSLRIEGEMTVFRAAELMPLLSASPPLQAIDLSAVTELDCAGVQLLLLARQRARAQGIELQLVEPSAAVSEVLGLLNVTGIFAAVPVQPAPGAAS